MSDFRKGAIGGGNLIELFEIATGAFTTSWVTLDKQVGVTYTGHPASGNLTITADSRQRNEDLNNFLAAKLSTTVVSVNDEIYENDSKDTVITGLDSRSRDGKDFGFIAYMAISTNDDGTTTKREVLYGRAILADGTGDSSTSAGAITPISIVIQAVDQEAVTIGSALFDADMVTITTGVTVGLTEFGAIQYMTP